MSAMASRGCGVRDAEVWVNLPSMACPMRSFSLACAFYECHESPLLLSAERANGPFDEPPGAPYSSNLDLSGPAEKAPHTKDIFGTLFRPQCSTTRERKTP